MSLVVAALLWVSTADAILQYGRCPQFEPEPYELDRIAGFERINGGEVLYFSNVRFERLVSGAPPPVDERYLSEFAIQLEYSSESGGEDCFLPFELVRKTTNMSRASSRRQQFTIINTQVIAMIRNRYIFAFSCVEDGLRKLEYVWILRNRGAAGRLSRAGVQRLFGGWLANTSTTIGDLLTFHDELPFCSGRFWEIVVYYLTGLTLGVAVTAAIVYLAKNKRVILVKDEQDMEQEKEEKDDVKFSRMSFELATVAHH